MTLFNSIYTGMPIKLISAEQPSCLGQVEVLD